MRGQQIQRPREGNGGRLVTGHHQGHDLVADLRLVHPLARLRVARVDQAVEDVSASRSCTATGRDHAVHDAVQALHRALPFQVVGRRDPGKERHQGASLLRIQVDYVQDLRDLPRMPLNIAAEQGRTDDPERQPAHLAVDPDDLVAGTHVPSAHQRRRERIDRLVEAVDVAAAEHRLHELALLHPVRPVAGHQAVAHHLRQTR